MAFLPGGDDARLLVGLDSPDDGAVYSLDGERALVVSVDFFTPLVDEPEDFGAIAAANALSDLYAMNAEPAVALSILAVPAGKLGPRIVGGILRGATDVCAEAGIVIAGGHSIDDREPKFGLVAIGFAHPDRLFLKSGAQPGDALVLGKAIGTGVIATGIKRGIVSPESEMSAIHSMRQLNRSAMKVLAGFDVHAATDVSGFGLLGHLREMCRASDVAAVVEAGAPRLLPGAVELARDDCVPGGSRRNRMSLEADVAWSPDVDEATRTLLCDAQTSGGLLAAVPAGQAVDLAAAWAEAGYQAAVIGRIEAPGDSVLRVEA